LFKNQGANYFTIDKEAFILDAYEKSKIDKYLRSSGTIQLTKKYKIVSPKMSYYAMNVFVIPYSNASDDSVNAQILAAISEYFLNLNRMDRIPKLDLIRKIGAIRDIHSVDIQFVCKKNEDYHKDAMDRLKNQVNKYSSATTVNPLPNYSPSNVIGLDPTMGDIIFESDEIPVIRGDWFDRNGTYYSDDIDSSSMKAVNIIKKGTVDAKNQI
jgi:hypothetical protein